MKKTTKKLVLAKDTLRNLGDEAILKVLGGTIGATIELSTQSSSCASTTTCPE